MKLVVDGESRRVVGAHVLGPDAGEMAQLLAISLKAKLHQGRFRPNHGGASIRCRGTRHQCTSRATGSGTASGSAKRATLGTRGAGRRRSFRSAPIRPAPATACRQSASGRSRDGRIGCPPAWSSPNHRSEMSAFFIVRQAGARPPRGVPHGSSSMPIDAAAAGHRKTESFRAVGNHRRSNFSSGTSAPIAKDAAR